VRIQALDSGVFGFIGKLLIWKTKYKTAAHKAGIDFDFPVPFNMDDGTCKNPV